MTVAITRGLAAVTRVSFRRLVHGRALWIAAAIAALPVVFAAIIRGERRGFHFTIAIELLVLAVVPALLVAAPIGDEIESRTATYVWSRAVAREAMLLGKLAAALPIAIAYVAIGWIVASSLVTTGGAGPGDTARAAIDLGASALAVSMIVAGLAALVPRHAMAIAIAYVAIDYAIGQIPASINVLSVTHQAGAVAEHGEAIDPVGVIAIAVLAVGWLALGLRRIRRLELSPIA